MSRTLILHVGSPKCGSTYLQQVMLANRGYLSENGIHYPHDGTAHPGNGLAALIMTQGRLAQIFDGHNLVVLSHEDLFAAAGKAQSLSELTARNGITVQIVAFLRPFSQFIFGDYSQFIKQHLDRFLTEGRAFDGRTFQQFTVERSRAMSATGFLKGWQRRFPDHAPLLAHHHQIRPTLERLLGVEGMRWDLPRDQSNPSLRMEDCDRIAAAVNAGRTAPGEIRDMLRAALKQVGAPDTGRTPERIAWIEAVFQKQTDDLQTAFGFDNRLKPAA
ncbi:hypothetical protein [Actibacterium sp. D379-3]